METPLEETVLDRTGNTATDWFGWAAIVCAIAGVVIGMIPIIGNYFRLVLGIVGLGLGLGGILENRRHSFKSKIAPIALALNIAVLIWVTISFTVVGTVIIEVVRNLN